MPKLEIHNQILPKQKDFLQAKEREVLYSGAFGAGKTRAVCMRLRDRAWHPGAREGLCRKHLVTLKATTLRTLLEPDGDLPPVLPEGTYKHNKSEKSIKFHSGGEIVYFGLDDEKKIGSMPLTGLGIDEAVELTKTDWTALRGRYRTPVKGIHNQLYAACNPGPPTHFLAARFGLAGGFTLKPNCRAIRTKSLDNPFLPDDYVDDLKSFTGVAKKRFVEGLWVGNEGAVYDKWDRQLFVATRELEKDQEWHRTILGIDEGYTNPAVILVCHFDNDGRLHIGREFYKTKCLEEDFVEQANDWAKQYKAEVIVVDSAAAGLRSALIKKGLPVIKSQGRVYQGILDVQAQMVIAGDGRARLTVDPSCENTIREFETYEWKEGKDEPRKQFDHAMDTTRNVVTYIKAGAALGVSVG